MIAPDMDGKTSIRGCCMLGGAAVLSAGLLASGTSGGHPLGWIPVDDLVGHSEQGSIPDGPIPVNDRFRIEPLLTAAEHVQAVAGAGANGTDTQLYVTMSESNLVVNLADNGAVTVFADLDDALPGGRPWSPAIDALGTYTGSLLFVDVRRSESCRIAPEGAVLPLPGADGLETVSVACDPYGAFLGRAFVTDTDGTLSVIGVDGSASVFAGGVGAEAIDVAFAPGGVFGEDMYIVDAANRRILRVAPSHEIGSPAEVWADLGDLRITPTSIAFGTGGPLPAAVMYVADESAGRIVKLDRFGAYLGDFAVGLETPLSIELPASGMFAGKMIISAGNQVLVAELAPRRAGTTTPAPILNALHTWQAWMGELE
jgi:hypothetical protein